MIQLFATDLDGTFVAPDDTIPEINLRALALAADKQIPVVIATGRPARWLDILTGLAIHRIVVVSNGAATFDLNDGELRDVFSIDPGTMLTAAHQLRDLIPGVTFAVEQGDIFGREFATPSIEKVEPWVKTGTIDDLVQGNGIIKLLAYHDELSSEELYRLAHPVLSGKLTPTFSTLNPGPGLLEMAQPGVSKAGALARICSNLGVQPEYVAAFGDMPNDSEMLDWAGHGFIVENAHPQLHASSYQKIPSCSDAGVGQKIIELLENS